MNYKEKKLRENTFRNALNELLIAAYDTPLLPLTNRRAVVASIHLGESVQHKQETEQQPFAKNYQQVYQGLHNAFHEKISDQTETGERLKHAIPIVASLAAWAGSNPNRTEDLFENFAKEMVPEDAEINPDLSPVNIIVRELHKELSVEKSFDFISIPWEQFHEKYRGR